MTICIKQPEATSHFNPLGKDTPNQAGLISHTQNENWYPDKKKGVPSAKSSRSMRGLGKGETKTSILVLLINKAFSYLF